MRQLKFRAFNLASNCYYPNDHFGLTMDGRTLQLMSKNDFQINESGSMIYEQLTGLTDKNGKEIYESDLVQFDGKVYQVVWGNTQACFIGVTKDNPETNNWIGWAELGGSEVIGNIHDNSELLK